MFNIFLQKNAKLLVKLNNEKMNPTHYLKQSQDFMTAVRNY